MTLDAFARACIAVRPSIGRVLEADSRKVCGTCFVVSPRHVLTCRHVIRREGSLFVLLEGALDDHIVVECFEWEDERQDLALCKLAKPTQHPPIWLADFAAPWGEPFETFGYPLSHGGGGKDATGLVKGPTSSASLGRRFELGTEANRIRQGFSGAPVLVDIEGVPCAIACISETGSKEYPESPSCSPITDALRTFEKEFPGVCQLTYAAKAPANARLGASELSESALWRWTSTLAPEASDEIVRAVQAAAVRARDQAQVADDARTMSLRIAVETLRTKYYRLGLNPRAHQYLRDSLSAPVAGAYYLKRCLIRGIVADATVIARDFERIPEDAIELANEHRIGIHTQVLNGYCAQVVTGLERLAQLGEADETEMVDGYWLENIERLFRSMANLLSADIDDLSHGYERGFSSLEADTPAALFVAAHHHWEDSETEGHSIILYELSNRLPGVDLVPSATLRARRTDLTLPAVARSANREVCVYATSPGFMYKWSVSEPTPVAERKLPGNPFIVDVGPTAIVYSTHDALWEIDTELRRERRLFEMERANRIISLKSTTARSTDPAYVTQGPDEGVLHLLDALGAPKHRLTVSDGTGLPRMSTELTTARDAPHFARDWVAVETATYLGSRIVLGYASLWPKGAAICFLAANTLTPLRSPVLVSNGVVMNFRLVRMGRRSLLVATFINSGPAGNDKLRVWDITDPFLEARELGSYHCVEGDALGLAIQPRIGGFDAYYVLASVHDAKNTPLRLYRVAFPEETADPCATLPHGAVKACSFLLGSTPQKISRPA